MDSRETETVRGTATEFFIQTLPIESQPCVDDKRRVIIERLPVSGLNIVLNPVKAKHLDNIDSAVAEANRKEQPLTALRIMHIMFSQLQDAPMSLSDFYELETDDLEVLGYALSLFRAYRSVATK